VPGAGRHGPAGAVPLHEAQAHEEQLVGAQVAVGARLGRGGGEIVVLVAGVLGAVKYLQIKTMIDAPKPSEVVSVATAVAQEASWPDTLLAVGSVSPAQGVTVSPEIAGKVSEIAFESGATVNQGDLLLRLDTKGHERFVQSGEFVARYTGGEANVAAALSQWGVDAFAVSKVPDHELG